jgi:hypothetical protein
MFFISDIFAKRYPFSMPSNIFRGTLGDILKNDCMIFVDMLKI